ncbi:MAG: AraC family transcriptional regulator [Lachnospiraceae bacterium]|nr:AraC family transcriptional regulator [Lachnospiraceae bacterium]
MNKNEKEICEDYGFLFCDNVENPAVRLTAIGWQKRNSREYYWDNRERPFGFLFQYTLKGSGTLKTGEGTFQVREGEAFFVRMPEEEIYYFDEENNKPCWEFIYIMFSGSGVLPYYQYIVNHLGKVLRLPEYHPAVKQLFELHFQAKNGLLQNAFTADCGAFRFLCLLCDMSGGGKESRSGLVEKAKAYMEENFQRQISLCEAAAKLGVSQSHLSREFFKYTGEQPVRYLTRLRVENAVKLLHEGNMTIEEISARCGFSDGNYFNKVFKRYMKVSPGELRKQMREQGYLSVKV